MPTKVNRNQGKGMFVKETLNDNPLANAAAVNEAWKAAGMSGSISATLISNVRSRLGLAGSRRGRPRRGTKATGARRGRSSVQVQAGSNDTTRVRSRARNRDLMELEVEIDRLLFKVAEIGTLPDVEDALRNVRRNLYAGMVTQF